MFDSIMEPVREKWLTLTKRDQNAVAVLLIAMLIMIIVFGLVLPVKNSSNQLAAELKNSQDIYSELVSLAPQALASSGTTQNFDASAINTEVRRQAVRYGVVIQRFVPEGEFLKVWLEDARYPSVVQWLGSLETIGIGHTELAMEDRPKPGFVSVRVTFGVGQ